MDILPQLILNSIIAGSLYALVALGFNLIYGTTKFFNLAHGVVAAVGGYVVFYLVKELGIGLFISVPAGVLMAGFIGYAFDKAVYRPLRRRKATGLVFLVASLGLMMGLQAIIAILFTSQSKTLSMGQAGKGIEIFGGVITEVQLIILVSTIVIMAALIYLLKRTIFGKSVRAIGDDEEVSKIVGINTDKVIGRVFFIGSAIAGLAGILVGFDTSIHPTMGTPLLLKGVIASIIGGLGSVYGAVLGAFLLGFAENFGIWKISGEWKDAIAFVLLLIFLLFRPKGIIKR